MSSTPPPRPRGRAHPGALPRKRRRALPGAIAAALAAMLVVHAGSLSAQPPDRQLHLTIGIEAGAMHSTHPHQDGPLTLGGFVALERGLGTRLAARAALSIAEAVATGDDVSICYPLPGGGCLPDARFPLRVATLEALAVFSPDRSIPVRLLAGGGLAFNVGQRRNIRVTDHMEHDRALKGIARVGVDLGLGRSSRAPRLQYTRGWLSGDYESFDRLDQLSLVLRF